MAKIYDLSRRPDKLEDEVIAGICDGDSMEQSARKLELELPYLFSKYRKAYPDFDEDCAAALEAYCDRLENDLKYVYQKYSPKEADGMSKNMIKLLEFYNPKRYSPKQQHDITMQMPDISKALDEAERRVVEATKNVVQITASKKRDSD